MTVVKKKTVINQGAETVGVFKKNQSEMDLQDHAESSPNIAVGTENDFIFGKQSALVMEEFNVLKTNRHSHEQKRVLVIE